MNIMSYLNEVYIGQKYKLDGKITVEVINIRITNIIAWNDYIVAVTLKDSNGVVYDEKPENIIPITELSPYKLIQ